MPLPEHGAAGSVQAVHEDADLLVLCKPAGLLCVPGRGPDKQDCLSARAQQRWPGALVVHRLDQATSGLVLMARHLPAQRLLSHAFAERQVRKRYVAVVHGRLEGRAALPDGNGNDSGNGDSESESAPWNDIHLPIAADWPRRPLRVVDPVGGKPSHTRWRALRYDAGTHTTRVVLEPVTGRTHQLRVHLAALGHPILGDALYADAAVQALSPRLLLHASSLQFDHPATGHTLCLEWPPDF